MTTQTQASSIPCWTHAHGEPDHTGILKQCPEDFRVCERYGFERSGEGEFLYLDIEKTNLNTADVVTVLSSALGLHPRQVNYSGLKDKQAVTQQWFSLHLPGLPDPDLSVIDRKGVRLLSAVRHHRKLRRGTHQANTFTISLRDISGDRDILSNRLDEIAMHGVPNYFGDQRFGKAGQNIPAVMAAYETGRMPRSRHLKGLYHSAARAYLFNCILQERVRSGCWNKAVTGELFILDGSQSWFGPVIDDNEIENRLACGDIHPSCTLWGRGEPDSSAQSLQFDNLALTVENLASGLEQAGLRQERRATRLKPGRFDYQWSDNDLILRFELQKGQYATSLVRELITEE